MCKHILLYFPIFGSYKGFKRTNNQSDLRGHSMPFVLVPFDRTHTIPISLPL